MEAANSGVRLLTLREYEAALYKPGEFGEATMALVRDRCRNCVDVQPPFVTGSGWRLTAQGFVGYLPVTERLAISLQPKTPIHNLLRMLEVAYQVPITWGAPLFEAESLVDFYQRLAVILANRTIDRCRQGIYRTYTAHQEELAYVCGRLDTQSLLRRPWQARLRCEYDDHTADVEENQLILWTLHCILASGLCSEDHAAPRVRLAYRLLLQHSDLQPFLPAACLGRTYTRLNADYQAMHALCYFFLDHTGPSYRVGERQMMPFVVDMAALFEKFVAAWMRGWLQEHFDGRYDLLEHQTFAFQSRGGGYFDADLLLREAAMGRILSVLDTKYKIAPHPSSADVAQVVAYATAFDAPEAVLIYPSAIVAADRFTVGSVVVRTLPFQLDGDLDRAGAELVDALLDAEGFRQAPEAFDAVLPSI